MRLWGLFVRCFIPNVMPNTLAPRHKLLNHVLHDFHLRYLQPVLSLDSSSAANEGKRDRIEQWGTEWWQQQKRGERTKGREAKRGADPKKWGLKVYYGMLEWAKLNKALLRSRRKKTKLNVFVHQKHRVPISQFPGSCWSQDVNILISELDYRYVLLS